RRKRPSTTRGAANSGGQARLAATFQSKYCLDKHLVRKSSRDCPSMFRLLLAGPGIPHMSSSDIAEEVARRRSRRDAKRRAAQDLKATRARLAAGTSIKPEF